MTADEQNAVTWMWAGRVAALKQEKSHRSIDLEDNYRIRHVTEPSLTAALLILHTQYVVEYSTRASRSTSQTKSYDAVWSGFQIWLALSYF